MHKYLLWGLIGSLSLFGLGFTALTLFVILVSINPSLNIVTAILLSFGVAILLWLVISKVHDKIERYFIQDKGE